MSTNQLVWPGQLHLAWDYCEDSKSIYRHGKPVAKMLRGPYSLQQMEAHAKELVHAVNSYAALQAKAALVDRLADVLKLLRDTPFGNSPEPIIEACDSALEAYARLRSAPEGRES
jgi:hypothetical protein